MPDRPLPPWLDRRTALWCADLCDALAERTRLAWPDTVQIRIGVEAAGMTIRGVVAGQDRAQTRAIPKVIPFRSVRGGDDG